MKKIINTIVSASIVLLVLLDSAAATELGIRDSRFTINGEPAFLYGISYYGALGASRDFIRQDLDDMRKAGFNWIRVWATWSAFGDNVSAVDSRGRPRQPYMDNLKWLLSVCDRCGIIVDITLTPGEGRVGTRHFSTLPGQKAALETLAAELQPWRNCYFDLSNESNLRRKHVSFADARALRDAVKKIDAGRLVTISYVGDATRENIRRYIFDVKIDFLAPHRPRNARSAAETMQKTRTALAWMHKMGRVVPVHYQEPFRRDFSKNWQPRAKDFLADLQGAIEAGAAGWCFHNGDNKWSPDGKPRRSFDMRKKRLFEQLDKEEQKFITLMATLTKAAQKSPYPPSPVIAGITFHRDTLVKAAPGSDQFGTTWAGDDNLYTAWGDGGGFQGTNQRGRASLGVARIQGNPPAWKAVNVWGGVHPLSHQPSIKGKTSSGVIAVHGTIYLFVSEQGVWTRNHLWKSADRGLHWQKIGLLFNEPGGAFGDPGIIQFGRDYSNARDNYIYGYSEKPWKDGLALFRVPQEHIAERGEYTFFAGIDDDGKPLWTKDIHLQKPAFSDPHGTEWGITCFYHPVLRRYLLSVRHDGDTGRWGIFDAPEPWGPWTTVAYGNDFPDWTYTSDPKGASPDRPAWIHTFPVKWISADGKTLWHISDRGDRFNLIKATLKLRSH